MVLCAFVDFSNSNELYLRENTGCLGNFFHHFFFSEIDFLNFNDERTEIQNIEIKLAIENERGKLSIQIYLDPKPIYFSLYETQVFPPGFIFFSWF